MSTVTLPNGTVLTRTTRADVLGRIASIDLYVIPYNQGAVSPITDKRADCSGLDCFKNDTPDSGRGIYGKAYNTGSLFTEGVMIPIGWDDLLPGDSIGYLAPNSPGNGGHVATWMGGDKRPDGTFDVWDHGSGMGPKRRQVKWDGQSTGWLHPDKLAPWRYVAIVEDDGTTYEPGQSLEEDDVTVIVKKGDKSDLVKTRLQDKLEKLKPGCLAPYGADKSYGNTTALALAAELGVGDGSKFTTGDEANLDRKLDKLGGGEDGLSDAERAEVSAIAEAEAREEVANVQVTVDVKPGA